MFTLSLLRQLRTIKRGRVGVWGLVMVHRDSHHSPHDHPNEALWVRYYHPICKPRLGAAAPAPKSDRGGNKRGSPPDDDPSDDPRVVELVGAEHSTYNRTYKVDMAGAFAIEISLMMREHRSGGQDVVFGESWPSGWAETMLLERVLGVGRSGFNDTAFQAIDEHDRCRPPTTRPLSAHTKHDRPP